MIQIIMSGMAENNVILQTFEEFRRQESNLSDKLLLKSGKISRMTPAEHAEPTICRRGVRNRVVGV